MPQAAAKQLPNRFLSDSNPGGFAKGFLRKLACQLFGSLSTAEQLGLERAARVGVNSDRDFIAPLLDIQRMRKQGAFAWPHIVDGTAASLPVRASRSVTLADDKQRPLAFDCDFVGMLLETAVEFDLREA